MAEPMTVASALAALGWDAGFEAAFEEHAAVGRQAARVIAVHKQTAVARTGDGGPDRSAVVSGRFRWDALGPAEYPAVGDWVAIEPGAEAPDATAVIAAVLPRRSAIRRSAADSTRRGGTRAVDDQVIAANVDVAFIVAGLDGDFNLRRLERYLAVAWSSGVTPVMVLNKADVAADLAGRRVAVEAIAPGVDVLALSARFGDGLDGVRGHLGPGRTAVVVGSSGVGKSTLVNALLGEERQATREVREDDARGRHTTTHRELFALPGGALLIDTPGIRALEVAGAEEGVSTACDDIETLAAACRFTDCRHESEPGCAVRAAVGDGKLDPTRLEAFRKLERELAHQARRDDPVATAEERRRWRSIHKAVGRHMDAKYGEEWR